MMVLQTVYNLIQVIKRISIKNKSPRACESRIKYCQDGGDAYIYKQPCIIALQSNENDQSQQFLMKMVPQIESSERQKWQLIHNNSQVSVLPQDSLSQQTCGQYYRQIVQRIKEYWHLTCGICVKEFQKSEMESFAQCQHSYKFCKSCLNIYIRLKLMTYEEIYCPNQSCKAPLDLNSKFFKQLPLQTQRRFKKIRASMQKLHDANFRTCPVNECEGNIIFKGNSFQCTTCIKKFCIKCLAAQHKGQCYYSDIQYLQNHFNMRRCPNCKFMVEKSDGCYHMTCRCKFQFCFTCNAPYTSGHICRRDSRNKVIMQKPVFKEEKDVTADDEPKDKPYLATQEGIQENILLGFFVFSFIIPLLAILLLVFLIRMSYRGLVLSLEIAIILLAIMILGIGPFTMELARKYGKKTQYLLLIIYPVTMMIGIYRSFRQLAFFTIIPLLQRFKRNGGQLYRYLLFELFQ